MNISILTVFSEIYKDFLDTSILKRAQEQGSFSIDVVKYSSLVKPKERIDSPTFGPGPGMLIKPEVVEKAVAQQTKKFGKPYTVFLSPQGKRATQKTLRNLLDQWQKHTHLMFVSSRYEGMDARVEQEYADEVISIGDFVLMGGDIPIMLLIEGITRLLPGVIGKADSVEQESFTGPFLDFPEYTEPIEWKGKVVPEIIRSGNHAAIATWREKMAAQKTVHTNFPWIQKSVLITKQKQLVSENIPPHSVVLMHADVLIGPEKEVGTTSVTSIDIHDIARSAATYGIDNYYLVTPLQDQQRIIKKFLSFWQDPKGQAYNPNRYKALERVHIAETFEQVIKEVEQKYGDKPIIIGTSAHRYTDKVLSYHEQSLVFRQKRPVVILLGTGRGLSPEIMNKCDYILEPLEGLTDFNHLSVRSAAAIIFDRWLGISPENHNK